MSTKRHHSTFKTIACAAALTAALTSPLTAMAQSGSRICGWRAKTPNGEIGMVYEARQNDVAYTQLCDHAIDQIKTGINKDQYLKPLPWAQDRKATCESTGSYFASSNSPGDMCDKMAAHCVYQVVKNNATNTTTYKQLSCSSNTSFLFNFDFVFDFLHDIGSALDPTIVVRDLSATFTTSFASFATPLANAYLDAVAEVQAVLDAALLELYRYFASVAVGSYHGFLAQLHTRMTNLDSLGMAALNRLTAAATNGQIDENVRSDMALLANKLGLAAGVAGSIVPTNIAHSSWGIYVGGAVSMVVGAKAAVGIAMDTGLTDGRYRVALTASAGGMLGITGGTYAHVGIFWQPGTLDDIEGGYVGLGVEADAEVGVNVGVQWSLSPGMSSAYQAIPGFSLGFGVGLGFDIGALEGGYTFLAALLN